MSCLVAQMSHLSWVIAGTREDIVTNEKQKLLRKKGPFQYQMEYRSDPFEPFINQRVPPPDNTPPPMQNFKLAAVVVIGKERVAMVEDASGKGYYLNKGSRVGKSVVSRIEDKQVELTETYSTTTGRIVTKEIIMYLKKEGDK